MSYYIIYHVSHTNGHFLLCKSTAKYINHNVESHFLLVFEVPYYSIKEKRWFYFKKEFLSLPPLTLLQKIYLLVQPQKEED